MGNNILTIIKKECRRFFGDKRLVFTTVILPAVFIYALYSLMGAGFSKAYTVEETYMPQCYVQNMPQSMETLWDSIGFQVTEVTDAESAKTGVENMDADLLVIFPEDFEAQIAQPKAGAAAPDVAVYYNSTSTASGMAYDQFVAALEQFEASVVNVLDVNRDVENPDLATDQDFLASIASSVMPMMVIMLIATGCMAVAPESIAGEKERGTIATLLVTPVSRTDLAVGKIISLSLFALLSGLSSFVGVILSLPKMVGMAAEDFSINLYGFSEYACLLLVIVATVLMMVSLMSVISALSKTVKQASSTATVLMMFSAALGIIPMFAGNFSGMSWRLVPILNSALCMQEIFSFHDSLAHIVITCVSNLIYMVIFVVVLSKMFNSEKIMFNKG